MRWLVKEEPTNYSFDAFAEEGTTTWSGVRNPVAQKHLRSMKPGDKVFYYHTGKDKAVIGTATVAGAPYPDPKDKTGKLYTVELEAGRRLARPVTLAEIKANPAFKDFALVRLPRLSVMPVTDAQWSWIEQASKAP
ncbi:MAG: EVE domain-containing protein [Acidobacteriota bacterium]